MAWVSGGVGAVLIGKNSTLGQTNTHIPQHQPQVLVSSSQNTAAAAAYGPIPRFSNAGACLLHIVQHEGACVCTYVGCWLVGSRVHAICHSTPLLSTQYIHDMHMPDYRTQQACWRCTRAWRRRSSSPSSPPPSSSASTKGSRTNCSQHWCRRGKGHCDACNQCNSSVR